MEITAQNFYETLEKLVCHNLKPWKLTYFSLGENFLSLIFCQGNLKIKLLIHDLCLEMNDNSWKIKHISKK